MSESRCGDCANDKLDRNATPCMACVDNDTAKVDVMVRTSQYIAKAGAAPEPATEPAVAGGAGADTDAANPNADAEDEGGEESAEDSEETTE